MNLGGEGLGHRGGHDGKARALEVHECLELIRVQAAKKSVAAAAKIPDHAWLRVIDVPEIHLRPEVVTGKLVELRRRKTRSDERENNKGGNERRGGRAHRGPAGEAFGANDEK